MTDSPPGIGKRIASYRKYMGVGTAKDLADKIGNPKITAAVIQNIESGRKVDLSVAQLLDIAHGLGVSPIFLLAPVGRPLDKVDLANVSEDVAQLTTLQLDEWFRKGRANDPRAETLEGIRRRLRELVSDVNEYRRLAAMPVDRMEAFEYEDQTPEGTTYVAVRDERAEHEIVLGHYAFRIDVNAEYLKQFNVDLSWAEDVIQKVRGASG